MKINPDAVTIGPPISTPPFINDSGQNAPWCFNVPSGTCQSMSPVDRFTAASEPHGGLVHGAPNRDSSGVIVAQ